jgi:uncharacterized protein (TIGR02597 family)
MKKHTKAILAFAVIAATMAVTSLQADVYTDPVGFVTMTALGTGNSPFNNPYVTLVGLGMTQVPVSRGNATATAANKVGVNASLTPGQFNKTADGYAAYWIEITSGAWVGYQTDIVSNDASSVFTVVDLSGGLPATYKIYPHWTIGTLFGPQNQAGFLGGSSTTADQIQVWNVGGQAYSTAYYYKTTGAIGGTGWRSTASLSVNVTNVPVYIDQSLLLSRRVSTNLDVKVVGGVKLTNTISTVYSNGAGVAGATATIIGNVYPAGQTLGTSGFYTGDPTTGLAGGSSTTADQLQLWVPGSQGYSTAYYYKTTGAIGGTGWRSTASLSADASTNQIPLGASVLVLRRVNRNQFNWSAPQPFTQ